MDKINRIMREVGVCMDAIKPITAKNPNARTPAENKLFQYHTERAHHYLREIQNLGTAGNITIIYGSVLKENEQASKFYIVYHGISPREAMHILINFTPQSRFEDLKCKSIPTGKIFFEEISKLVD